MKIKNMLTWFTCCSFFLHVAPVAALDFDRGFSGSSSGQAEFFNSNRDKRMQIQVSILSGVARPGVHQIPDNTSLLDALALAGGLTADADFEGVHVRRRSLANKGQFETLQFDVEDLVQDSKPSPILQNYDTIVIDPRPKTDQKLMTALAIIASTVGIVSGVIIIRETTRK